MNLKHTLAVAAAALLLAACSTPGPDYDALATQMMVASFRTEGIATLDRLQQDESNQACSQSQGMALPEARAAAIQQAALKSVRMPTERPLLRRLA